MQRKPTKRWWRAYGQLYGKTEEPKQLELPSVADLNAIVKKELKKAKANVPTEQDEQFVFVAWLTKKNIIHHHSPNGGFRDVREAAKFKRLGTKAGFPDILIPYARKSHHGLLIELKRVSGGKLSEHQLWWRDFLIKQGYAWFEAKGANEAIRIVEDYFRC